MVAQPTGLHGVCLQAMHAHINLPMGSWALFLIMTSLQQGACGQHACQSLQLLSTYVTNIGLIGIWCPSLPPSLPPSVGAWYPFSLVPVVQASTPHCFCVFPSNRAFLSTPRLRTRCKKLTVGGQNPGLQHSCRLRCAWDRGSYHSLLHLGKLLGCCLKGNFSQNSSSILFDFLVGLDVYNSGSKYQNHW